MYLHVGKMKHHVGFFLTSRKLWILFSDNTQNLALQVAACHLMKHEWKIVKPFPVALKGAAMYLLNTFLVAKSTLQIPSNFNPTVHSYPSSTLLPLQLLWYNSFQSLIISHMIEIVIRIKQTHFWRIFFLNLDNLVNLLYDTVPQTAMLTQLYRLQTTLEDQK